MSADDKKQRAAAHALGYVEDGMVVGLGTGSTAEYFVRELGRRVEKGLSVVGVATSVRTAELAARCGIAVAEIEDGLSIDVTVDGADEVDPNLCLIKGGGGALLREKIVAAASDRMIVIIDDGKLVDCLGAFPLPVEIVPFGYSATRSKIDGVLIDEGYSGRAASLRRTGNGEPFISDDGHYILDCACAGLADPGKLAERLRSIPGIVEHGLFIGLASAVIVGRSGGVDVMEAESQDGAVRL